MINKNELLYKIEEVIEYLKKTDFNIIEYAEDVLSLTTKLIDIVDNK